VVEHGRNGYLAGSVDEMAMMAMEFLETRPDLARAAEETWERRFRLERYRAELMGLLEQVSAAAFAEPRDSASPWT